MDVDKLDNDTLAEIGKYRRMVYWHVWCQWATVGSVLFFLVASCLAYL